MPLLETAAESLQHTNEELASLHLQHRSVGVRGDLERARQFLEELAANPDAELPDPGEAIVEHIEPRIERPMPDASQFINRGNGQEEASQPFQSALPNPAIDPDAAWWRFNNPSWASPASEASDLAG